MKRVQPFLGVEEVTRRTSCSSMVDLFYLALCHRVFNSRGKEMRRWKFPTGGSYTNPPQEGSFELFGNRVIRLGTNM